MMGPRLIVCALVATGIPTSAGAADLIAEARFACDGGKAIEAAFYPDRVSLALSDGRHLTLPQTISGSGARYADADESVVFWNKGNTAFVTEGAEATQTFSGCIEVSGEAPADWKSYASAAYGFSLRYPPGFTVDAGYIYQGLGPGRDIHGVAFVVPPSITAGTNLAGDTQLSVETLPDAQACTADLFLPAGAQAETDGNDTAWSVASLSDAGAGNLYDETVYALVGSSPCLAVRYFVHSANLANYDPGTVRAFDATALGAEFDAIRRTLIVAR